MKIASPHRRAALAAMAAFVIGTASQALAAFPEKPVKLIVPFPAGGFTDLVARIAMSFDISE